MIIYQEQKIVPLPLRLTPNGALELLPQYPKKRTVTINGRLIYVCLVFPKSPSVEQVSQ